MIINWMASKYRVRHQTFGLGYLYAVTFTEGAGPTSAVFMTPMRVWGPL